MQIFYVRFMILLSVCAAIFYLITSFAPTS